MNNHQTTKQKTKKKVQQTVAVIVPFLNEEEVLPSLLAALLRLQPDELIFVDGGSDDGSLELLQKHEATQQRFQILKSTAGRAAQMNAGARQADADILLFLHADTRLPDSALSDVQNGLWGRFDIQFHDSRSSRFNLLTLVAQMMNLRSKITGIATGDQAMFVNKSLFQEVGGFDDIPLMEDVSLSKKLKRHTKPHCINQSATTSARRWQQNGVVKTIVLMWALRFGFFIGVSPHTLWQAYRHVR